MPSLQAWDGWQVISVHKRGWLWLEAPALEVLLPIWYQDMVTPQATQQDRGGRAEKRCFDNLWVFHKYQLVSS